MKIKIVRRISLVDELVKTTAILFVVNSVILFGIFYFITERNLITSLSISLGTSFLLTALYTYFLKRKLESVLGKLYYVATLVSENQENVENILIPIAIYEELEEIIKMLEDIILDTRKRYEGKIKELELSYEPLLEKSSSLIKYIEQLKHGYLNAEDIPEGIDPVGAMGIALKESIEELKERIHNIKLLLKELHVNFRDIEYRLEQSPRDEYLEQKLKAVESIINKLENELSFFK